jgi:outer membrane murein-binding lipoprotein Lpp
MPNLTAKRTPEPRTSADRARYSFPSRFVAARIVLGAVATSCLILAGCFGPEPAKTESASRAAETKPATPAIPDDVQGAAKTLLGSDVQVLAFGDLAKNGNQEFLAVNVLPKTPTNTIPGLTVSRASVAENRDGKWMELMHCDEHLKNQRGMLALTPVQPISSWRLQFEQDDTSGLRLYFTPEKTSDPHVLPIGVGYNPKTQRYQSLDRAFEKFLPESQQLGEAPRSTLR